MDVSLNTRILVIDDEEIVRDSFQKILKPRKRDLSRMESAEADLFGTEDIPVLANPGLLDFHIDQAANGKVGYDRVVQALADNRPYAVIFIDMRMPGWDGLETAQHIRRIDAKAQIFFVTAFSDHSIEEIVRQVGADVGYHCKPFVPDEIRQIAIKGVYDWNKLRNLEKLINIVGDLKIRHSELNTLLNNILHQVTEWIGTDSALVVKVRPGQSGEPLMATGTFLNPAVVSAFLARMADIPAGDNMYQASDFFYFPLDGYGIAVEVSPQRQLNTENLYLIQLFLKQAAQAIENLELQDALVRHEKLSAIGQAISKVVHDLRNPISCIYAAVSLANQSLDDHFLLGEMHKAILTSTDDALSIVSEVLDFVKNSKIQKHRIRMSDLLEPFRNRRESPGELLAELSLPAGPDFELFVDQKKLQRALLNLVSNAEEALRSSGTRDPRIVITFESREETLISVADNGPGIHPSIQNRLFEPFVTYGKSQGTGLGLSIVKQIVDMHDGRLAVSSSDLGTVFTIHLPNEQAKDTLNSPAPVEGQPIPF